MTTSLLSDAFAHSVLSGEPTAPIDVWSFAAATGRERVVPSSP